MIPLPSNASAEFDLRTMDFGQHAHVGMMATDNSGFPFAGPRTLTGILVDGDYTATLHIEPDMWVNIDFNSSAVLTFNVVLYEVSMHFTSSANIISHLQNHHKKE